jgi:hypothetical protein
VPLLSKLVIAIETTNSIYVFPVSYIFAIFYMYDFEMSGIRLTSFWFIHVARSVIEFNVVLTTDICV